MVGAWGLRGFQALAVAALSLASLRAKVVHRALVDFDDARVMQTTG